MDKVDAMDKVDWITCGVWRPRAALHVIYCLVAALPRCATRVSFVGRLGVDQCGFAHSVNVEPGRGCPEACIYILNVLYAFSLQPLLKGFRALFGIDRNPFFPGRAPAEHAIEFHSGFCR